MHHALHAQLLKEISLIHFWSLLFQESEWNLDAWILKWKFIKWYSSFFCLWSRTWVSGRFFVCLFFITLIRKLTQMLILTLLQCVRSWMFSLHYSEKKDLNTADVWGQSFVFVRVFPIIVRHQQIVQHPRTLPYHLL